MQAYEIALMLDSIIFPWFGYIEHRNIANDICDNYG